MDTDLCLETDYDELDDFIIHDNQKAYQLQERGGHIFLMYVGYMIEKLDVFINRFTFKDQEYKIYSCIYNLDRIDKIKNSSYPIFKITSSNFILSYDLVTQDIFDIKEYKFNIVSNGQIIDSTDNFLGVESIGLLLSKL